MKVSLLPILFICCGCAVAEEPIELSAKYTAKGHTTDSVQVVKESVAAKKAVLIDVREQGEWDDGHLKLAKLIPMSVVKADALTDQMKKHLDKEKPVYLHCRSGGRVLMVSKLLKAKGYDVRPLSVGYSKLIDAGFEKATDPKP